MRRERGAEGRGPGEPSIVEYREIAPIVGDQGASRPNGGEKLGIIREPGEIEITGADDVVASRLKRRDKVE